MAKTPQVFLESHNIKNLHFGFGQFNYHLIKGLYNAEVEDFKMTLHAKDTPVLKKEFGTYFNYKTYQSFRRYPFFRIRKKYDVWHSMNQNIKIEPYHDIPYVLTIHDVNFIDEVSSDMNHERNIRFKEKLHRASAITYISEFAKQSTHQYFDVPNVPEYVIYNGNPIRDILIPEDYKPEQVSKRRYLFSIGEFTERKNFHTLVEMLAHLKDYDLILSGNNNTSYTQDVLLPTIEKLNLQDRVIITGKISDIDKQYYLKSCDAFVFPSLREGFGIPPIEAMRFGKPVFLSNNTSLPEIGGEHAFYWDNYDAEYMANIVSEGIKIFNNNTTELSKLLTERALSFNWDDAAKSYIEVYKSLL
ncbi:glycosyltransferase family 4 protein [Winogradskyella jejuensis]|uniref:Glycosyltransferase involved in cell wall bisynthesis n=1 Tax=Winogradskyella jejuensis TaxID=1089305 RepID=A0A1M5JV60_9FLAO|nr:glycosyltransferase family 1 protein [Winogradskyella jejuensis]SHG44434.1 Glycosyltransferase involved in cell wall bisynthesis [Winogradskyella jejuensis]